MSVHIRDIYEVNDTIDLACELFYISELGKYLKYYYNDTLSMSGITFDEVLLNSDVWSYFCIGLEDNWFSDVEVNPSWLIDIGRLTKNEWKHLNLVLKNTLYTTEQVLYDSEDDLKRRKAVEWYDEKGNYMSNLKYNLLVPKKMQIGVKQNTDGTYFFAFGGKDSIKEYQTINNSSVNGKLSNLSWITLFAYFKTLLIKKDYLLMHKSAYLTVYWHNTLMMNETTLAYSLILRSTKALEGWVKFEYDEGIPKDKSSHLSYVAWYIEGYDKGFLSKKEWYNIDEKKAFLTKFDICKGDVILLYERSELQKSNHIKEISDVRIAVVEQMDERSIKLNIINTRHLMSESRYNFEKLDEKFKKMYITPPYLNVANMVQKFDYADIGVYYAMADELNFIMPLTETLGSKMEHIYLNGEVLYVYMPQNQYIYWLLREYDVYFDIDRFKERYLKDVVCLYDDCIEKGYDYPRNLVFPDNN